MWFDSNVSVRNLKNVILKRTSGLDQQKPKMFHGGWDRQMTKGLQQQQYTSAL